MIGRLHHLVVDCPDPAALADFWSRLLGLPVTYRSPDFVVVAANDTTSGLAFQLAINWRQPSWPAPDVPQQMHWDVMVEDLDVAGEAAISLLGDRTGRRPRVRRSRRSPVLPDTPPVLGAADRAVSGVPAARR